MPFIIVTGLPSSGKTTRTKELAEHFKSIGKNVTIISEISSIIDAGFTKNTFYHNSQQEKQVRAHLKSQVIALLNPNDLIILDGSNYIKGFRYELYCASKASKTTQCTIFSIINIDEAWNLNVNREKNSDSSDEIPYDRETFDALVLRYEEPNSQNRWDRPLFISQPKDGLNFKEIYEALYEKKPPPPNMSTQNPPLSNTNFLYELDKITLDISKQILENKKINPHSDMRFPSYPSCYLDATAVTAVQPIILNKLRRQFLIFARMQYSNQDIQKIGSCFIRYLNTNLQTNEDV